MLLIFPFRKDVEFEIDFIDYIEFLMKEPMTYITNRLSLSHFINNCKRLPRTADNHDT